MYSKWPSETSITSEQTIDEAVDTKQMIEDFLTKSSNDRVVEDDDENGQIDQCLIQRDSLLNSSRTRDCIIESVSCKSMQTVTDDSRGVDDTSALINNDASCSLDETPANMDRRLSVVCSTSQVSLELPRSRHYDRNTVEI